MLFYLFNEVILLFVRPRNCRKFIYRLFLTTHLHPDDAESDLRESLRLLQVDYVDLYLAHMPVCFIVSFLWRDIPTRKFVNSLRENVLNKSTHIIV
uniref:Aldo_ket_red domain-containing protein n=1 Tax=Angiostrongylus cantonensis TaxID=6313 RepID=A0A0K0D6Z0_ANGCA